MKKAIKALVDGISGAAVSGTAELIKKVKPKIEEKKKTKERSRERIPTQNRVGINDKTKGINSYDNGGKTWK